MRNLEKLTAITLIVIVGSAIAAYTDVTPTPPPTPRPPYYADNPPPNVTTEEAQAALKLPDGYKIHNWLKDDGWEFFKEKNNVKIYTRIRPGEKIKEGIGIGMIDGSPCRVVQVLCDNPNVPSYMPYVRVSLVKRHRFNMEYFCQYLDLPWPLSDRLYNLYGIRYNLSHDGVCEFLMTWEKDNETCPCTVEDFKKHVPGYKSNAVYTEENLGYWHLVGKENNTKTWAEYYVFTDPGGRIPPGVQNWFVDDAISSVFEGARERLKLVDFYPDCNCSRTEIP